MTPEGPEGASRGGFGPLVSNTANQFWRSRITPGTARSGVHSPDFNLIQTYSSLFKSIQGKKDNRVPGLALSFLLFQIRQKCCQQANQRQEGTDFDDINDAGGVGQFSKHSRSDAGQAKGKPKK